MYREKINSKNKIINELENDNMVSNLKQAIFKYIFSLTHILKYVEINRREFGIQQDFREKQTRSSRIYERNDKNKRRN